MDLRYRLLTVLTLFCATTGPAGAGAATITYILDLTVPGTFTLKATASADDNAGIFLYGVPLLGNVLTLDNRAPVAINADNFATAGFDNLRSSDITSEFVNPLVTGAQNPFGNPANWIHGVGQEASGFAGKGINPLGSPDPSSDTEWLNPVVLATGTYAGSLSFNTNNLNLVGNVLPTQQSQTNFPQATIHTITIGGPATPPSLAPTPQPAEALPPPIEPPVTPPVNPLPPQSSEPAPPAAEPINPLPSIVVVSEPLPVSLDPPPSETPPTPRINLLPWHGYLLHIQPLVPYDPTGNIDIVDFSAPKGNIPDGATSIDRDDMMRMLGYSDYLLPQADNDFVPRVTAFTTSAASGLAAAMRSSVDVQQSVAAIDSSTPAPEPTTIALIAIAATNLLRHRPSRRRGC
jgi:hypothetical protein